MRILNTLPVQVTCAYGNTQVLFGGSTRRQLRLIAEEVELDDLCGVPVFAEVEYHLDPTSLEGDYSDVAVMIVSANIARAADSIRECLNAPAMQILTPDYGWSAARDQAGCVRYVTRFISH